MSRVFIYPAVNLDNLQADKSLEVTDDTISLKGEESSVTILNSYVVIDDVELCGSVAVLKHLAEHHDHLMIASDMFYGKGEDLFDDMLKNMFDESFYSDLVFDDFATLEMLNFSDEYGWSNEFIEKLSAYRRQIRAELGVKVDYSVGDRVSFDYCGADATSMMSGKVIFADKHHAIVQVPSYTYGLAAEFNRNTMPLEQVEAIVGKPISETKNDWLKQKEQQAAERKLANKIKKIETEIEETENAIAQHGEEGAKFMGASIHRFIVPEGYHWKNVRNTTENVGIAIKNALLDLNFLDVKFEIVFTDSKQYSANGFDEIEFTHLQTQEKIYVWVKKMHYFSSFEELYKHFDKISLGYKEDEVANPTDMEQFYSKENINKYGVVGIEIELIEKGKSQVERINNTIKIVEEITGEKIK